MKDGNYISVIANRIRSNFNPDELPEQGLDLLFGIYAVLALTKGEGTTDKDVHDAWSLWASKYNPESDSLIPFEHLSSGVQAEDSKFTEAIRSVSRDIKGL